ncbi:uncharacterized protein N7473_003491 [Penicillium subrubescens]|uniref:uncharacterized protein n=1 Tax=Penicillium subrubescens TaxID=1316194 RepID=UPI0025450E05|nr:uncharacterized protein N7473_003491 [Penicillium subrubescens]KAJ5906575.1 hypothetical protein N7473_003491 [Penicillium subrubescens]
MCIDMPACRSHDSRMHRDPEAAGDDGGVAVPVPCIPQGTPGLNIEVLKPRHRLAGLQCSLWLKGVHGRLLGLRFGSLYVSAPKNKIGLMAKEPLPQISLGAFH